MEFFAEKVWLLSLARKASEKRFAKSFKLVTMMMTMG